MSDRQETIADIIAEMRMGNTGPYSFAYLIGRAGGLLGSVIERVTVKELADRLEAAHKRELAERGDAAALREALQAFAEWFDHDGSEDGYGDIRDKARAALSAPPRNCERFATADDAKREFNYLWDFVWQRGGGCLNERNYVEEFERWLFAYATEQEGGADV